MDKNERSEIMLSAEQMENFDEYLESVGAREEDDDLIQEVIEDMCEFFVIGEGSPAPGFFFDGFRKIKDELYAAEEEWGDMSPDIALVTLGDCYREGKGGMEQDDEKAFLCYEAGTATDCINATQMLGVCYFEGRGVERDYEAAFMLLCREMDGRKAEIFRCRGLCFFNGWGTEQNYDKAFEEFSVAAENFEGDEADALAKYYLGVCCEEGKGTERDLAQAAEWYGQAAEQGVEEARERLRELQK